MCYLFGANTPPDARLLLQPHIHASLTPVPPQHPPPVLSSSFGQRYQHCWYQSSRYPIYLSFPVVVPLILYKSHHGATSSSPSLDVLPLPRWCGHPATSFVSTTTAVKTTIPADLLLLQGERSKYRCVASLLLRDPSRILTK